MESISFQTEFPIHWNHREIEQKWQRIWKEERVYQQLRQSRLDCPIMAVIEAPLIPLGGVHFNHFVNKTIKDMLVRFWSMRGHDVRYVPTWNDYGSEIEYRAQQVWNGSEEIRQRCREIANEGIQRQTTQFRRLGILADWDNPRLTSDQQHVEAVWRSEILTNLSGSRAEYDQNQVQSAVDRIQFVPTSERKQISNLLEERTNPTIVRPGAWGIPFPSLICIACGHQRINDYTIQVATSEGVNLWLDRSKTPTDYPCDECDHYYHRNNQIMDRIVSGLVHLSLDVDPNLMEYHNQDDPKFPDEFVIIESRDKHAWIADSIQFGLGVNEAIPCTVITHGQVVSEMGHRLSRTVGDYPEWIDNVSLDALRLMIASQNVLSDMAISDQTLSNARKIARKIRNTFRFILGWLHDFDLVIDRDIQLASLDDFPEDRFVLAELYSMVSEVEEAFGCLEFHRGVQSIHRFCAETLSAFYYEAIKNRLNGPPSDGRLAATDVLILCYDSLCRVVAPLMPHLAEELWSYMPVEPLSIALADWADPMPITSADSFRTLLDARRVILKEIGSNRDPVLLSTSSGNFYEFLQHHKATLQRICVVPSIEIELSEAQTHDMSLGGFIVDLGVRTQVDSFNDNGE